MASTRTPPFSLGVIAVIAVTGITATTLADDWCGTRVRPEDVPIVRDLMAMGVYDPPPEPLGAPYVSLTFHVVRRSDGTGGLDDVRLVRALDDANLYYANSGITFCWPGPTDYIDDDDFYYNIDTMDEIDALRSTNVVPDTINIYFTENLELDGVALCGISSFTFSPVQGIVMANGCTATDDNHSTFPHEIGHYFDLFHTHEMAFGVECVARTNCDEAGDLLCDTPADPGLYQHGEYYVDEQCQYTGSFPSPCDGDPPYEPDTANLMSYSRKYCRTHFSPQQDDRALATLVNLRPELINADCPGEGQWNLDAKLLASDGAPLDHFGVSVALNGDRALMGAHDDDDNGTNSGSAYIFENVGGVWVQTGKPTASDGAPGDYFGYSVGLDGNTALIGAYRDDDHASKSGSAYIFEKQGGVWVQTAKLTAADGAADDYFGVSVALDADRALIGAYGDGNDSGSAYVFERDQGGPDNWGQVTKLAAADGTAHDLFAYSVALDADRALIGAEWDDDNGTNSGSAYIFEKVGGVWVQTAKLTAADGAIGDEFGHSVCLSGDTGLVGACWDDDHGEDSGSAYVLRDLNALRNPCPGDLDGDWDTDQADLGILLADWGCTAGYCPGDLDNDGDTDQADLGILLADWGCTP